jgi:hypothetical protein
MFFGSDLDVFSERADDGFMIFQQGFYDVILISEIMVVVAQPRNRSEVFE